MGLIDKVTGKTKQAIGDLADDPELRREGRKEEQKGEAKERLAEAEDRADEEADRIARLERERQRL